MASLKQMTRSHVLPSEPRACILEGAPSQAFSSRKAAQAPKPLLNAYSVGTKTKVNSINERIPNLLPSMVSPSSMCFLEESLIPANDVTVVNIPKNVEPPVLCRTGKNSPDKTTSARRQTARKTFPCIANGNKETNKVLHLQEFVLNNIKHDESLKSSEHVSVINTSTCKGSESSVPKIRSLQSALQNRPCNMADARVPVIEIDDSIQKVLQRLAAHKVLYKGPDSSRGYQNFTIKRISSHDVVSRSSYEKGFQQLEPSCNNGEHNLSETDDKSIEMPPLLCPSEIKEEVHSERELSKSPEMPVLYPVDKEDFCAHEPRLSRNSEYSEILHVSNGHQMETVPLTPNNSNTSVSTETTPTETSSNVCFKRSVREAHFQGRYAYMVGKRVRDPSLPPRKYRRKAARMYSTRGRPLSSSAFNRWAEHRTGSINSGRPIRAELCGVRVACEERGVLLKFVDSYGRLRYKEVSKQQLKSADILEPLVPKKVGRPYGPGRKGKRGRPRLKRRRGDVAFQHNPHVDVIDGLEFLSFETERDLKWFMKQHPSYTLDLSQLTDLDICSILSSNDKHTLKELKNNTEPPRSRLPGEPIFPTKTLDISKIKGWRNKVFAAEALANWSPKPEDRNMLSLSQRLVLLQRFTLKELEEKGLADLIPIKRASNIINGESKSKHSDTETFKEPIDASDFNRVWKGCFENGIAENRPNFQQDNEQERFTKLLSDSGKSVEKVVNISTSTSSCAESLPTNCSEEVPKSDKSAFVSDFLDEFLRTDSELKITTPLSTERMSDKPEMVDTKVVWPTTDETPTVISQEGRRRIPYPLLQRQLLKKNSRLRKKRETCNVRTKRAYRRLKHRDMTGNKKQLNISNGTDGDGNGNSPQKSVMAIEPVVMSLTDALFATTALVSRSVWSSETEAPSLPDIVSSVNEASIQPSRPECKGKEKKSRHLITVTISIQHAYRAASALAKGFVPHRQTSKAPSMVTVSSSIKQEDVLEHYDVAKLEKENRKVVWPKSFKSLDVPSHKEAPLKTPAVSPLSSSPGEPPSVTKDGKCSRPYCKLGCVCDSLKTRKRKRKHCGKVQCMFSCSCYSKLPLLNETETESGVVQSGTKRRRQIRLPARLQDSAYLWNRGKESLIDSNTGVPLDKPRDTKFHKVLWNKNLDYVGVSEPPAVKRKRRVRKNSNLSAVGPVQRRTNYSASPRNSLSRYPPVNVPSVFPTLTLASPVPIIDRSASGNDMQSQSPMLLMVDKQKAQNSQQNGAEHRECHLLLNQDGSLVPCVLFPIHFDPMTKPIPATGLIKDSAVVHSGSGTTQKFARQTARKTFKTSLVPENIKKDVPNATKVVNKQTETVESVVQDVVKDMINRVTLQLAIERSRVRDSVPRYPPVIPKPSQSTLRSILLMDSNPSACSDKKTAPNSSKLRYAGLPHDWQCITKPMEESPEYSKKNGSSSSQSVTNGSEVSGDKRAAQRRIVECNRRIAIRSGLKSIASLVAPFVRDSKKGKEKGLPVHYFVLDMAIEVILQLKETEQELIRKKQSLIQERMELFKKYTESLRGIEMTKQKSALTELTKGIQDCCVERTQRRQSSHSMLPIADSFSMAVMPDQLSNDLVLDLFDSGSLDSSTDSEGDFSGMSIFDSSDNDEDLDANSTLGFNKTSLLPEQGNTLTSRVPFSVTVSLPAEKLDKTRPLDCNREKVPGCVAFPFSNRMKSMKQYLTIQASSTPVPQNKGGGIITVRKVVNSNEEQVASNKIGHGKDKNDGETLRLRAPGSSPVWIPLHKAGTSFTATPSRRGDIFAPSKTLPASCGVQETGQFKNTVSIHELPVTTSASVKNNIPRMAVNGEMPLTATQSIIRLGSVPSGTLDLERSKNSVNLHNIPADTSVPLAATGGNFLQPVLSDEKLLMMAKSANKTTTIKCVVQEPEKSKVSSVARESPAIALALLASKHCNIFRKAANGEKLLTPAQNASSSSLTSPLSVNTVMRTGRESELAKIYSNCTNSSTQPNMQTKLVSIDGHIGKAALQTVHMDSVVTIRPVSRPNDVGPQSSLPYKIIPVTSRPFSSSEITVVSKSTLGSSSHNVVPAMDMPSVKQSSKTSGMPMSFSTSAKCSSSLAKPGSKTKPKPSLLGHDEIVPIITLSLPSTTGEGEKLLMMTPERAVTTPPSVASTPPAAKVIRNFITSSGNVSLIALPRTDEPAGATTDSTSTDNNAGQTLNNPSFQRNSKNRMTPHGSMNSMSKETQSRTTLLKDFENYSETGDDDDYDDDDDDDDDLTDDSDFKEMESSQQPTDNWIKIVSLTSISEDEFRCKDDK